MKYTRILLIGLLTLAASCSNRRIALKEGKELVQTDRYAYTHDEQGRWYILSKDTQSLKEAMKTIQPGPANVDKVEVWVITPLRSSSRK